MTPRNPLPPDLLTCTPWKSSASAAIENGRQANRDCRHVRQSEHSDQTGGAAWQCASTIQAGHGPGELVITLHACGQVCYMGDSCTWASVLHGYFRVLTPVLLIGFVADNIHGCFCLQEAPSISTNERTCNQPSLFPSVALHRPVPLLRCTRGRHLQVIFLGPVGCIGPCPVPVIHALPVVTALL